MHINSLFPVRIAGASYLINFSSRAKKNKMSSDVVKIIGTWASPYVMRAKIAFNIKNVAYESIEEDLFDKSDLLLKSNPVHKKVPVLLHGEKTICESLIIVQYIDQVWASGPEILPSDPYDRAIARFWASYIDTTWFPNVRSMLVADGDEATITALSAQATEGLKLLEDAFVKCSKGKRFFGGDRIGYLDIALGSFLVWVKNVETEDNISLIDESKTPHLFKWRQEFCGDVAVKDVLPEPDKISEYRRYFASKFKASRG